MRRLENDSSRSVRLDAVIVSFKYLFDFIVRERLSFSSWRSSMARFRSHVDVSHVDADAFLLFISGPHNAEVELPLCRRFLVCDISKDQHGSWGN